MDQEQEASEEEGGTQTLAGKPPSEAEGFWKADEESPANRRADNGRVRKAPIVDRAAHHNSQHVTEKPREHRMGLRESGLGVCLNCRPEGMRTRWRPCTSVEK